MVGQIYPTDLQLNKANSSDIEASFLDFNLSIIHGIVSSKKIMMNRMILILKKYISRFLMGCSSLPFLWCIYFSANLFCKSVF